MISIPEMTSFSLAVKFLKENPDILLDFVRLSISDDNSFSRVVNEKSEIVEDDDYNGNSVATLNLQVEEEEGSQEEERKHSTYVENMFRKIQKMRGARGILHIDISEFYRSIYTHAISAIGLGLDKAKACFLQNSSIYYQHFFL